MNWIKKHFNKILIACLTLISSIAIFSSINNTYAYESDKISYTIENINTITSYDISNYNNYIDISYNGDFIISKDNGEYFDNQSQFLLINYMTLSNGTPSFVYRNTRWQCTPVLTMTNGTNQAQSIYVNQRQDFLVNNQYFTSIIPVIYTNNTMGNIISVDFAFLFNTSDTEIRIYNVDFVSSADLGLDYYYETYYSQIEDNYNQLQQDYNDLEDEYETLEGNYNTLESNYNTLQDNYDSLQENYNSINDIYKYGSFAFIDEIYIDGYYYPDDNEGDPVYTTLNVIQNKQTALANFRNDSYDIYILNTTYPLINATIQFNFNNLYLGYVQFLLKSPSYSAFIEYYLFDENNSPLYYRESIGGDITIDIEHLQNFNADLTTNCRLYAIRIDSLYNGDMYRYQSLNANTYYATVYNTAFTNGVIEGKNQLQPEIDYLNNEIVGLNDNITSLESIISTQRLQISALQEQVSSLQEGVNLNSLFWVIASTPFESFKQIWNVNFLGVNISGLITGFLTSLIVLFIVKKFFL